jgi:stearoyl-CoA desaturase (delta-9 desaturase)
MATVTESTVQEEVLAPGIEEDFAPEALERLTGTDQLVGTNTKQRKLAAGENRAEWRAERQKRINDGLDVPIAMWLVLIHVGALAAPFTFSWAGLGLFVFMNWLTGSIGICLGFHRQLTHRSFKSAKITKWIIAWIGGLAGEGSAIHWVANHRKHHALSDQVGDPHSPLDGSWWSHVFWTLWARSKENYDAYNKRWAPDLADDKVLQFLDRTFILWHIVLSFAFFGVGYAFGGSSLAWSLVVWGMFLRMTWTLHSTWFVNSASHIWGYRTYETTDDSRNNWWVALFTFGEGWHNNHHAFPSMARAGHRWWEIDVTFWAIRLLEKCGLIWDVVDGHHKTERAEKRKTS